MGAKRKISDRSALKDFYDNGCTLEGFDDARVLSMLFEDLFGSKKYDNVKLAETLLNEFRSVSGVLYASPKALGKTNTLEYADIVKLKYMSAFYKVVMLERCKLPIKLSDEEGIAKRLGALFSGETQELLYIFPVVGKRIVSEFLIDSGNENSINISMRRISDRLDTAENCTSFIMAHNHPDGVCKPSENDIIMTGKIYTEMEQKGYKLLKHYLYTRDEITTIPVESSHMAYFFGNK